MTELNEKYLILKLKKGDKAAFEQLFDRYYPIFLAFTRKMVKDDYAVEDILQNVFMRVWINRDRLDENRSLKNYLLVAVRNEIYYHLRSELKNTGRENLESTADHAAAIIPDISMAAKETEGTIMKTIETMPERRREVFEMSREQELSNNDIAQRLGISVRTVEKHIENALSDLKKNLPAS